MRTSWDSLFFGYTLNSESDIIRHICAAEKH